MKKYIIILILIFSVIGITKAESPKYFVPFELKASAYPAHVEITFHNRTGFEYEVYRSLNQGKKFVKAGETNKGYFLDFFGKPVASESTFIYRVLPKGMSLKDKNAEKYQISVNVKPDTDEALLDMTQRYTTRYFFDFAEPKTGMARERSNDVNGEIVTTGGTGFGIMALIAGAERNYLSRNDAFSTIRKTVDFLENAERFHGAWAHWYDARSGKPFSFSKYDDGGDLVETAFLVQGLLTAREYFKNGNVDERLLANRITQLWETVEWNWYTRGTDSLYWHWSKNHEWKMNHRIKGFDETLITYVLAASSPTYAISKSVYDEGWARNGAMKNGKTFFDIPLPLGEDRGGPMFFAHYSFMGLDPRGLSDAYANYWTQNTAHAQINYRYCVANPRNHFGYSADSWGLTASDIPTGYTASSPNNDGGTIAPTAALASFPYTPDESMRALKFFYYVLGDKLWGEYGFRDAFNLNKRWFAPSFLAIDQGPIVVMIENHRTGLPWQLFMQNDNVKSGLEKLGFTKG